MGARIRAPTLQSEPHAGTREYQHADAGLPTQSVRGMAVGVATRATYRRVTLAARMSALEKASKLTQQLRHAVDNEGPPCASALAALKELQVGGSGRGCGPAVRAPHGRACGRFSGADDPV